MMYHCIVPLPYIQSHCEYIIYFRCVCVCYGVFVIGMTQGVSTVVSRVSSTRDKEPGEGEVQHQYLR
jgi:hypothetical protein